MRSSKFISDFRSHNSVPHYLSYQILYSHPTKDHKEKNIKLKDGEALKIKNHKEISNVSKIIL